MKTLIIVVLAFVVFTISGCAGLPEPDTSYSYGGLAMDDPLRQTDEFKAGHAEPMD